MRLLLVFLCLTFSLNGMNNNWWTFLFGSASVIKKASKESSFVEEESNSSKDDVESMDGASKENANQEHIESHEPNQDIQELCDAVTKLYFPDVHTIGQYQLMKHLPTYLKESPRRKTLEELFSNLRSSQESNGKDEMEISQKFDRDTPEIEDAKSSLHTMVMQAVEESFQDKEKETDRYRHDIARNRLKLRLAIITALTTGFTTALSSLVAIIIALTNR